MDHSLFSHLKDRIHNMVSNFAVVVVAVVLVVGCDAAAKPNLKDSECHKEFMKYLNDSIGHQEEKMEFAPFSCSDPFVQSEAPGSRPEHWDAFEVLLKPLYWDGGEKFPKGILFAPQIGGMPEPTGKAADYFHYGIQGVLKQAKAKLPNLCTPEGAQTLVDILQADYYKHQDDFKEYAEQNCDALLRDEKSLAGARNLLATGAKAVIEAVPKAAAFVPDERVRAALAEIIINFDLDSEGDTIV